jgi:hypothetical protein
MQIHLTTLKIQKKLVDLRKFREATYGQLGDQENEKNNFETHRVGSSVALKSTLETESFQLSQLFSSFPFKVRLNGPQTLR